MSEHTAEFRAQEIKIRRLEINATLAAWKSEFFNDGIERPMKERARLEAELAALDLEQRLIGHAVEKAKVARREKINASLLAQLQVVLIERGLSDVLSEAQSRSDSMLKALEGGAV